MKTEKNTEQLKCGEIELLIDEHLEGMIALSDKEIMEEHISKCDSCRKYLQETESLLKKTASIPQDAVNLSVQKKNDLWKSVESKIDKNKYTDKKRK